MAMPGTPGIAYTADGLEHTEAGIPSSQARDHRLQLDKRERKLVLHDYGARWADIEGDGRARAVITFGSITGAVREAVARAAALGVHGAADRAAPAGAGAARAPGRGAAPAWRRCWWSSRTTARSCTATCAPMYDLPGRPASFHRPGPLPLRPAELTTAIVDWARTHQAEKELA